MNPETILYKQNSATSGQVLTHLLKCDENFVPKLSSKVDIAAYSLKLVQNSITFEAWEKDELVGLVAAYFNDEENKTGFITNVSTVKELFGKWIASKLMELCIEYALEKNFSDITLEVSVKNDKAVNLYKQFNFKQVEVKNDLIIMKKKLK